MAVTRSTSPTWSDSESEPDDLITPCPCQTDPGKQHIADSHTNANVQTCDAAASAPTTSTSLRSSSSDSSCQIRRRCSTDASVDIHGLWEAMLELQQRYHCYNSTRMMIATDSHDSGEMMPSRTCLDLLNDSIEDLPAEGWAVLERYLAHNDKGACSQSGMG